MPRSTRSEYPRTRKACVGVEEVAEPVHLIQRAEKVGTEDRDRARHGPSTSQESGRRIGIWASFTTRRGGRKAKNCPVALRKIGDIASDPRKTASDLELGKIPQHRSVPDPRRDGPKDTRKLGLAFGRLAPLMVDLDVPDQAGRLVCRGLECHERCRITVDVSGRDTDRRDHSGDRDVTVECADLVQVEQPLVEYSLQRRPAQGLTRRQPIVGRGRD